MFAAYDKECAFFVASECQRLNEKDLTILLNKAMTPNFQ